MSRSGRDPGTRPRHVAGITEVGGARVVKDAPSMRTIALLLVCSVAACGGGGPPEVRSKIEHDEAPSTEHLAELIASNTAFAADLYRFAASQDTGNLFISPHSISTTLGMTYAGA